MASSKVPTCKAAPACVDDLTDSPAFTRRLELLKHLSAAQQDKIEALIEHVSREIGDGAQGDMMLQVLFECLRGKKDETMSLFREARESRSEVEKQKREKEAHKNARKVAIEKEKERLKKDKAEQATIAESMMAPAVPIQAARSASRVPQSILPKPPQTKKRNALVSSESRPPQKKARTAFIPCEGDWKCPTCGYWNHFAFETCVRNFGSTDRSRARCQGARDASQLRQEGGPDVKPARRGARWWGDWICAVCCFWNRYPDTVCHKCKKTDDEVMNGQNFDDALPLWHEPGLVTNQSRWYWQGGSQGSYGGSMSGSAGSEMAAYFGTKGQSKESREMRKRR